MSTQFIMFFAIGVFVLMLIGIILTMIEFNRLIDDPSIRKGSGGPDSAAQKGNRENAPSSEVSPSNEQIKSQGKAQAAN